MKEWVISIVSTILIVSSLSMIMPNGKLGKYVKSILSVLVLLVIVKPVLSLKNISFDDFNFSMIDVDYQTDYLEYITNQKVNEMTKTCKEIIKNNFKNDFSDFDVELQYETNDKYEIILKNVQINLSKAVINSFDEHKIIIDSIKNEICNCLNIEKSLVVING